jgi:hypothetical protein
MPLKKGKSNKVISFNIKELVDAYKTKGKIGTSKPASKAKAIKQAVAIAYSKAGKGNKPKAKVKSMVKKTKMVTLHKAGKKPIKFKEGGEHESLGVPAGKKIPESKHKEAAEGKYGKKAKKQEMFRRNVLTGRKKK